uniref:NADH-ubiquinone oxidoreductase chain 6 n=1 Tax=Stercorarius maccormicki TaxID=395889 RepID=A0A0U1XY76_STEMC|nr:NADH dehydrogenase subunit 6 [Stercorarius maccormicki]YP_010691196.1 NADH dehydrogenase subunit 6 [Stercorarius lonnbergi]AJA05090.1 NADH dehydrogenase subunit 6 [Stercorarius maccormicki]UQV81437.1 NADH dehydrogenase subunit 6 [Stercorarius maccormicki]WBU93323.1 NADH dehydrogenase subunit 6 [Stercorarius lonnbergi]WBU93349.1 NADH dehydrogenase subunit 6 [Stercorarius maccormicki]WBU93362.1 NADH dehydrogenase subunit 6 [Stercorarius lonnbergi]
MTYFVLFMALCFVLGGLAVASNPSPYYGVVGLVLASVAGCGWLLSLGVSFVSLVLFMVYLGGMLVVFVYSVSLAADPFPEAWGDWQVVGYGAGLVLVLGVGMVVGGFVGCWGPGVSTVDSGGMFSVRLDFSGVAMFYSWGVGMFLVAGWGLLLTLFVVLELVRGLSRGAIRAV